MLTTTCFCAFTLLPKIHKAFPVPSVMNYFILTKSELDSGLFSEAICHGKCVTTHENN